MAERALAGSQGGPRCGELSAESGAAGGDTEGVGRRAAARHSDGARPPDPAGGDAGAASRLDGTFSETSFGFRPKHSAHQAVERAQAYIASGYAVVRLRIDWKKFFDRVNHDILMGLIARGC